MSWLQKLLEDETVFPTKSGKYPLPPSLHPYHPTYSLTQSASTNPLVTSCHFLGREFPNSFAYTAKHIYKHLFRIFAHIYHAHFEQILHLSIEAHFNSLFAHFLAFGKEFDLLVMKDLMTPQGMGQGVAELGDKWREMGVLEA